MISINRIFAAVIARIGGRIPDDIYLKLRYCLIMGEKLNLSTPVTFNEKLNWLKINYRNPLYSTLVDKSKAKDYVEHIIGREFIIPTYGIWNQFDDIDFTTLPKKFVLKSTNGGGGSGVILCKDKGKLDISYAKRTIEKSMRKYDKIQREWVYYDIIPGIIAEELLEDSSGGDIKDYKFFCFNGVVKIFKIDFDRYSGHGANYYDSYGNLLKFGEKLCPPDYSKEIKIPQNLRKMIDIAEKLSKNIPFVRVDLYNVNNRIYFGEMTFFPSGGMGAFSPKVWDSKIGEWLLLPNKNI